MLPGSTTRKILTWSGWLVLLAIPVALVLHYEITSALASSGIDRELAEIEKARAQDVAPLAHQVARR